MILEMQKRCQIQPARSKREPEKRRARSEEGREETIEERMKVRRHRTAEVDWVVLR